MPEFLPPILIIIFALVVVAYMNKAFDYLCKFCGKRFSIPFSLAIFAPHIMGTKLLKCPHCGHRTWAIRVPKENNLQ